MLLLLINVSKHQNKFATNFLVFSIPQPEASAEPEEVVVCKAHPHRYHELIIQQLQK